MKYTATELENGLTLVKVPFRGIRSATVLVGVGTGSRDESPPVAGISHFLEHMASKGTKKRPTPFEVASLIDDVGGKQNAATGKEFTEYWAKVGSDHLETAFDFIADNLQNPLLNPKEIEHERQVIIEEINMYEDTPIRRVADVFESLIYGKTSLGRDIIGSKKTVRGIERKDFLAHLDQFYQARNMVLVVAGKFEDKQTDELATRYFGSLTNQPVAERVVYTGTQTKPRLKVVTKETDQAHFYLGAPAVSYRAPDRYAVAVLTTILGASRTSRIYREIREKRGLAYYVHTYPDFYSDTGAIITGAGVGLSKLKPAVELVKKEYLRVIEKPVEAKELAKAKSYLLGRLALAMEDSSQVAARAALETLVLGRVRTIEEITKKIKAVTVAQVQAAAQKYLQPEKWNLAVIGPYKQADLDQVLRV